MRRTIDIKSVSFCLMILFMTTCSQVAFSQDEVAKKTYHFNGNVSVTNNGFSFIPTFSLGKPAFVSELSVGGKKFSFDPQFRFDLDGLKPWSFIFIWRYKAINTDKFQMRVGAHLPAISFRERNYVMNGVTKEQLIPIRFITPELIPTYKLTDKVSLGIYYIWGIGLEKEDQTKNTQFASFRAYLTNIKLTQQVFLKWTPQFYYINLDGTDGIYTAHAITLAHKKFPVSISSTMNIEIDSDVPSKDFDWNISLIYSFKNEFHKI